MQSRASRTNLSSYKIRKSLHLVEVPKLLSPSYRLPLLSFPINDLQVLDRVQQIVRNFQVHLLLGVHGVAQDSMMQGKDFAILGIMLVILGHFFDLLDQEV